MIRLNFKYKVQSIRKPAGLAQWLAHSLSKRKVRGSIPAAGTSLVIVKKKDLV